MTIGATPSASYLNDPFAQTSSSSLVSHKRISTSFSYTPDRGTTTSSSSVSTSSSRSRSFDAAPMMGADAHPRPQHSLYNPSHDELRQKHQQRSSLRLSKLSIGPEESMSCPSPPAEVLLVPSDLDAPAAAAASPGIAFQSNLQLDKAVWIDGSVAGLQGFPIMVDPHSARSRLTMEFVERSGIPVNIHSVIKFNVKVLIAHDVHVRVGGRTTLQTALVFPDSLCAADVVLGQPWIHQLHVRKCDESPHTHIWIDGAEGRMRVPILKSPRRFSLQSVSSSTASFIDHGPESEDCEEHEAGTSGVGRSSFYSQFKLDTLEQTMRIAAIAPAFNPGDEPRRHARSRSGSLASLSSLSLTPLSLGVSKSPYSPVTDTATLRNSTPTLSSAAPSSPLSQTNGSAFDETTLSGSPPQARSPATPPRSSSLVPVRTRPLSGSSLISSSSRSIVDQDATPKRRETNASSVSDAETLSQSITPSVLFREPSSLSSSSSLSNLKHLSMSPRMPARSLWIEPLKDHSENCTTKKANSSISGKRQNQRPGSNEIGPLAFECAPLSPIMPLEAFPTFLDGELSLAQLRHLSVASNASTLSVNSNPGEQSCKDAGFADPLAFSPKFPEVGAVDDDRVSGRGFGFEAQYLDTVDSDSDWTDDEFGLIRKHRPRSSSTASKMPPVVSTVRQFCVCNPSQPGAPTGLSGNSIAASTGAGTPINRKKTIKPVWPGRSGANGSQSDSPVPSPPGAVASSAGLSGTVATPPPPPQTTMTRSKSAFPIGQGVSPSSVASALARHLNSGNSILAANKETQPSPSTQSSGMERTFSGTALSRLRRTPSHRTLSSRTSAETPAPSAPPSPRTSVDVAPSRASFSSSSSMKELPPAGSTPHPTPHPSPRLNPVAMPAAAPPIAPLQFYTPTQLPPELVPLARDLEKNFPPAIITSGFGAVQSSPPSPTPSTASTASMAASAWSGLKRFGLELRRRVMMDPPKAKE